MRARAPYTIAAVTFPVGGVLCQGALYLPRSSDDDDEARAPCVVLANGFSGTMDWIVPDFAARFAAAGIAAFIFDYRHLGLSEGEPRQIVNVKEQRADLRAALRFARAHRRIDPNRVALWGTSLGGSHVITLAAEDRGIAAVIANMPALDAVAGLNLEAKMKKQHVTRLYLLVTTLRLLFAAVRDALRGAMHRAPLYLDVYGEPGTAFFTDPDLAARIDAVTAGSATWQNRVAARFLLQAPRYREGTLERIAAPILFTLASDDVELSNAYVREKAAHASRAEVKEFKGGHFDLYHDALLDAVAADQIAFMRRALGAHDPLGAAAAQRARR